MSTVVFQKVVADCELLKLALEPLLDRYPHLSAEHIELVQFLEFIKDLNAQQSDLAAQLRKVVRFRREAELQGIDLRSRVAAQLRGKLGFTNEELMRFGVTPRRRVRRRLTEEEEPPPGGEAPEEQPEPPPLE